MTQLQRQSDFSAYLCSRAAIATFRRCGAGRIAILPLGKRWSRAWGKPYGLRGREGRGRRIDHCPCRGGCQVGHSGERRRTVDMDTPANRASMPKAISMLGRKVEEVAATILFLASPQNTVTRVHRADLWKA